MGNVFECGTRYDVLLVGRPGAGKSSMVCRLSDALEGRPERMSTAVDSAPAVPPRTSSETEARRTKLTYRNMSMMVREVPRELTRFYNAYADLVVFVMDCSVDTVGMSEQITELFQLLVYSDNVESTIKLRYKPVLLVLNKSDKWMKNQNADPGEFVKALKKEYTDKWAKKEEMNYLEVVWMDSKRGGGSMDVLLAMYSMLKGSAMPPLNNKGQPRRTAVAPTTNPAAAVLV